MQSKQLAKKIKQAREESGLKQADLAVRIGISAQLISAFETGRITPERKYIEKIAHFTKKPVFFFTGQKVAEALARVDEMLVEMQQLREILLAAKDHEHDSDA